MSTKKTIILIIEDEADIREMLKFALPSNEFILLEAENSKQAELVIAKQAPDLILLDWMLPGKSGIEFAKQLKQQYAYRNIPIIMLTAKAEEENKIRGLETGADDYVTKPFSPRELAARIKTVLRRGNLTSPKGLLQVDNLCLNIHAHNLSINGEAVELTPISYRLLLFFMKNPNRVYSREQLLQQVWTDNIDKDERTVDVQIKRLRKALSPFNCDHFIQTVRSGGYQFTINNQARKD